MRQEVEHWSLTTLSEKLVKIGAKAVHHGRYVTFQFGSAPTAIHAIVLANPEGSSGKCRLNLLDAALRQHPMWPEKP